MGRSGGGVINKRKLEAAGCGLLHSLFIFLFTCQCSQGGSTEGVFDALDRRTDSHLRNICE